MEKRLMKITAVIFGFGGYDDVMFGFGLDFSGDGYGMSSWHGTWMREPDEYCKWTKEDQNKIFLDAALLVLDTLTKAKKKTVQGLVGTPCEVTFEGNSIKSWRVLTEVI